MVYTTTYNDFSSSMWDIGSPFGRQLLWGAASIVFMLVLSVIDWQVWNSLAPPLYGFGIVLLIALLLFGTETKGAQSWLRIGSFSLQPSEFVKLSTILLTANMLSSIRIKLNERKSQLILFGIIALPAFFIILQPDPGSAVTFGSLLIIAYRKGLSASYYIALIALFLTLVLSFSILKPHQQDRINVWLQPEKCDPRGSLYNLLQSKLAIGSGGFNGKGFLEGTLTKLNYVPEQTTDFIFSSVGEEQGFVGSAALIILFMVMVFRITNIGERSKHSFVLCVCYGVAGFIFLHFFLNIGMTMGLCPVIGIPLPFISKGGSSLMAFSMMIGIVLNMSKER
ncbi:UNVERIFIED_CONTAM: hypothetical protein GTU68_020710 [Idotea baltica]|nr:hypothetical protein [Idotea baltica]